jgi:protein-S-isoprenylcysteine O-methyltransferase Ste14
VVAELAIWICWGVVIVTWIAGAAVGARTSSGRRHGSGEAAAWQLGVVIAGVVAYRLLRQDLHRLSDHTPWIELPGLVILVVSTCFTVWARVRLGRMWSASPNTLQEGHELRTDGPYAVTRHPIYTGLLGMLAGTALLDGFGGALVLLAVGAAVVATRVPIEERLMSETFPDEYARYRRRVPALLPGLQVVRRPH